MRQRKERSKNSRSDAGRLGDVMTPEQRSRCMSRIRGKNTGPELALRRALRLSGYTGYRLHRKDAGNADIAFVGKRVAIFVDGCFWHGCPLHGAKPKNDAEKWAAKLARNKQRDQQTAAKLRASGWVVLRFWEHEIKGNIAEVVRRVAMALSKDNSDNATSHPTH